MSDGYLTMVPAGPDRLSDVVTVLTGTARHCLCQYWRLSASDYSRSDVSSRRQLLASQLADDPPGGLLAYLDGEPVGWCSVGPRSGYERLVRSRTVPAVDEQPVWSIVCLTVRVGFRGGGIAKALLTAVVDHARNHGARVLEAYPVDTGDVRIDDSLAYLGTLPMLEAAGFQRVTLTDARSDSLRRWLVRLDLGQERDPPDA